MTARPDSARSGVRRQARERPPCWRAGRFRRAAVVLRRDDAPVVRARRRRARGSTARAAAAGRGGCRSWRRGRCRGRWCRTVQHRGRLGCRRRRFRARARGRPDACRRRTPCVQAMRLVSSAHCRVECRAMLVLLCRRTEMRNEDAAGGQRRGTRFVSLRRHDPDRFKRSVFVRPSQPGVPDSRHCYAVVLAR